MTILEMERTGDDTPQGVVLMLVSGESSNSGPNREDPVRVLRMYNLASIVSLAKWSVAQKV